MFTVAPEFSQAVFDVLSRAGLPILKSSSMYSPLYRSSPLLDGVVAELDNYGFPAGLLPSGVRVIGSRPMRLLCAMLELEPPSRRLSGERVMPSSQELLAALDRQLKEPQAKLEDRAGKAIGITTSTDLLLVVRELFGDECVPMDDPRLKRRVRGMAPWGGAGFSLEDVALLQTRGVGFTEAKAWRKLGCSAAEIIDLRSLGYKVVAPWMRAGFSGGHIEHFIGRWDLTEVLPLIEAGCPPGWTSTFLDQGFGAEGGLAYIEAGLDWNEAMNFAAGGILLEEAKRWLALGMHANNARTMIALGANVEGVQLLFKEGLNQREVIERLMLTRNIP